MSEPALVACLFLLFAFSLCWWALRSFAWTGEPPDEPSFGPLGPTRCTITLLVRDDGTERLRFQWVEADGKKITITTDRESFRDMHAAMSRTLERLP